MGTKLYKYENFSPYNVKLFILKKKEQKLPIILNTLTNAPIVVFG